MHKISVPCGDNESSFTKNLFETIRNHNILDVYCKFSMFFCNSFFPSTPLPFTFVNEEHRFTGTFYYTISFVNNQSPRNAGMFWEPGLFQLYLNYALLMIVLDSENLIKNKVPKFILFSLTLLTTMSSMGFFCYIFIFLTLIVNRHKGSNKKLFKVIGVFLIFFVLIESAGQVIQGKLFNEKSSFGSRYDDAIVSLAVVKDNPFLGVGPVSDHVDTYKKYSMIQGRLTNYRYVTLARSNGLGLFMMKFGIPVTLFFLYLIYKRNKKVFNSSKLSALLVALVLIFGFLNEPIMLTTLWLSFFFSWKNDKESVILSDQCPPLRSIA